MAIEEAVVLAAGQGKRLQPLTLTRPKCMVQLAGKPILHHMLANLQDAGVKTAYVVVNYKQDCVRKYFARRDLGLKIKIEFIEQGKKYGTAAAFAEAEGKVAGTFFAVAGDVITTADTLRALAKSAEGMVSAVFTETDNIEGYGIAHVKGDYLDKLEEKPANPPPSALVNCSLYVFSPQIFAELKKVKPSVRGEYEVTDVLKAQKVRAVITNDFWLDVGMPWQLFAANEYLISRMPEKKGKIEGSTIKGKIVMEEGAEIINSYIEGPLYLGAHSKIGPHAYIRGCTSIGEHCEIGDSTTIKNSIIFDHVNAKHLAYIGDSVIGEGCNFGAGTQIANFRFDSGHIKAKVNDVVIDTRRRKLGAILGDNVKMGILSSVMPGRMIGDGAWIGANVMVVENVESRTHLQIRQDLVSTKLGDEEKE